MSQSKISRQVCHFQEHKKTILLCIESCREGWFWRTRQDSNPQPTDPKSAALSIELRVRFRLYHSINVKKLAFDENLA